MTHDELLFEVDELMPNPSTIDYKTWAALRAVVERHSPVEYEGKIICHECANLIDPWDENRYPCSTIEDIERILE